MNIKKLVLVFIGLFIFFSIGGVIMAYLANQPIEFEKQMAENFYYAAIGFAVYHIFTRNKQIREDIAKKEADAKAAAVQKDEDGNEAAQNDGDVDSGDLDEAQGEEKENAS